MNIEVILTLWTWEEHPAVADIPATAGYEFRLNVVVTSHAEEVKVLEEWVERYQKERYKITKTISYTMFEHIPQ